jgi:hypothetical protein
MKESIKINILLLKLFQTQKYIILDMYVFKIIKRSFGIFYDPTAEILSPMNIIILSHNALFAQPVDSIANDLELYFSCDAAFIDCLQRSNE